MKWLKIQIDSFEVKGDPDDLETLNLEINNKLLELIEKDEIEFTVEYEDEDDD